VDVRGGAGHGGEGEGAADHRGRGGDQLQEAHGTAVDDRLAAAEDQLGQRIPHRRALPHFGLQADVQSEGGRRQENSLLQRNQRLHLGRNFAHCHPGKTNIKLPVL